MLALPEKIMLVDGPLAGKVTDRPDTGSARIYYVPPAQVLDDADLPARFMVAAYLVFRCGVGDEVFWIGSVSANPHPAEAARVLRSAARAEQCRERAA